MVPTFFFFGVRPNILVSFAKSKIRITRNTWQTFTIIFTRLEKLVDTVIQRQLRTPLLSALCSQYPAAFNEYSCFFTLRRPNKAQHKKETPKQRNTGNYTCTRKIPLVETIRHTPLSVLCSTRPYHV